MTLNMRVAVFWSTVLCIVTVAVVMLQVTGPASQATETDSLVPLALPLFVVLLAVILFALSLRIRRSTWDAVGLILLGIVAATPSVLVILSPQLPLSNELFLFGLVFWLFVSVMLIRTEINSTSSLWSISLRVLLAVSTVATVFCEVGLHSPVTFAITPMQEVYGLRRGVDIRLWLGVLFVFLCAGTSIVRAFGVPPPKTWTAPIRAINPLPPSRTILAPLTYPIIVVTNGMLLALTSLLNVGIGMVAHLAVYLLNIGRELGKLAWQLLFEDHGAVQIVKALVAMLATFSIVIIAFELSPRLGDYLRADPDATYGLLPAVAALALTVLFGATILALVVDGSKFVLGNFLLGTTLLGVLLLLSGSVVYAIALIDVADVSGFERIGPISLVGGALVLLGIAFVIVSNVNQRRRPVT